MKIGILTQPLRTNYGGLLQNFALQQVLIRLGHDPITIDQKSRQYPYWRVLLGQLKGWVLYYLNQNANNRPRYVLTAEEDTYIRKHSIAFIDKFINHTAKFSGAEEFRRVSEAIGIEGFVVGSDQCWRPCYNICLKDMFLDFAEDMNVKKRVSYAASFGTDDWEFNREQTIECARLVKLFDKVTVREMSGVDLCKKHLGVDATHVLDPTMLLSKEDYICLIEDEGIKKSEGNLFNYILDPTKEKSAFIQKVCESLELKAFQVLPKCNEDHRTKKDVKNRIDNCVYPSPIEWLRAFMDAQMTIVDSFHGTVFSIIFNKPFWVIGNEERGMSRFHSLLSLFGLEDRLITESQFNSLDFNKQINWDEVNYILSNKRKESINILKNSLK